MSYKQIDDTKVYKLAFQLAMEIFEVSKRFPKEERYSLTDQVRRSSRSVCACLAEAHRKDYILHILFQKYQMQIWKIQKHKPGLNLLWHAITSQMMNVWRY